MADEREVCKSSGCDCCSNLVFISCIAVIKFFFFFLVSKQVVWKKKKNQRFFFFFLLKPTVLG